MLRRIAGPVLLSLLAIGCSNKTKTEEQAAAAASAEAEEIDKRSKIIAQGLIQQATDEANKEREAERQRKADARKELRQALMSHPGNFVDSSDLQMVNAGKRHLTSISLTNNSKFSISDIRGTVDFHGGPDFHADDGDILAHVPVQLTGAIAPGASMVFSEQQHTLSGVAIQLPKTPSVVTFTITSVKLAPDDDLDAPSALAGDAGVASQ
jgi:hypothetical protein